MVVDIHKKGGLRPYFDVYIGRRTRNTEFTKNSKWANPFPFKKYGIKCLELYENYVRNTPKLWNNLNELKGKILGCWCITTHKIHPIKCHGQILMKLLKEKERKQKKRQIKNESRS